MGFWTSATVLDFVPGAGRASRLLVALGLAGTLPAAAAGFADWSSLHREQQRVGLVHAASGAGASALFAASLLARMAGKDGGGRLLALGGLAAATTGGFLGRHLAFGLGAGASHAEPITHLTALGWHDLCRIYELPDGRLTRRQARLPDPHHAPPGRRRAGPRRPVRAPWRPAPPGQPHRGRRPAPASPAPGMAARSGSRTGPWCTGRPPHASPPSTPGSSRAAWCRSAPPGPRTEPGPPPLAPSPPGRVSPWPFIPWRVSPWPREPPRPGRCLAALTPPPQPPAAASMMAAARLTRRAP